MTEHVLEKQKQKLAEPPQYQVVMHNDDFTSFDLVIAILSSVFGKDGDEAGRISHEIHTKGKAICGVYTRDIAETKAAQAMDIAREEQAPLLVEAVKV